MNKKKTVDFIVRLLVVFFANLLLAFATVWFLEPAKLFAGGATGLAQLVQRLFLKFGLLKNVNLGWFILIANVPVIVVGIKYVSLKFTLYSGVAVGVQTVAEMFADSAASVSASKSPSSVSCAIRPSSEAM